MEWATYSSLDKVVLRHGFYGWGASSTMTEISEVSRDEFFLEISRKADYSDTSCLSAYREVFVVCNMLVSGRSLQGYL